MRTRKQHLLKLPLRTKTLLTEATKLEKGKFYTSAILLYSHYLEQFLLVATLSYVENKDPEMTHFMRENISDTKDQGRLFFARILNSIPDEILTDEIRVLCEEVKNIRNTVGAHHYFVIALDKTHIRQRRIEDVNSYRKFIRRLYSLIRKNTRLREVDSFLRYGHPLTIYRTIEEDAYKIEKLLMKNICKKTRLLVTEITDKISVLINQSLH